MNDVERMQADAVMRAKEMYNRRTPTYNTGYNGNIKYQPKQTNTAYAQNTQNTQNTSNIQNIPDNKSDTSINDEQQTKSDNETGAGTEQGYNFLDTLLADKERTLIILLIALLGEEKANAPLLLALMYTII